MRPKTFSIVTLGCRANQADSAGVAAYLEASGLVRVGRDEKADVAVINTCTVTGTADRQSRQACYRALRRNPEGLVVAVGCWARLVGQGSRLPDGLSLSRGAEPKDIAEDVLRKLGMSLPTGIPWGMVTAARPPLKIQNGCDEHCAYCVVRIARGPARSLPEDLVVERLRGAHEQGRAEVVLTGINLGAWGKDLGSSLTALLRRLADEPDMPRIRLSSIEPMEVTEELFEVMADHPDRICPFLHVPLQTGSDRLLALMGRPYGLAEYRAMVERAAERISDLCLGADVIAGLPTETEEDFEQTLAFLDSLPISYLHVFPYSERPGTEASGMTPVPDVPLRKQRAADLRAWSARRRRAFHETQLGRVRPSVLERPGTGRTVAVTDNYVTVRLEQDGDGVADDGIVYVFIEKVTEEGVFGRLQPAS